MDENKNTAQPNEEQPKKRLTSAERQELYMQHARHRRTEAQKKEKSKKVILASVTALIALLAVGAVICLIILNQTVWQPNRAYRNAERLYDEERYLDAYSAFLAMGDYADAKERAQDCIVQNARKLSGREDVVIGDEKSMPWFSIDENGTIKFSDDLYRGDGNVIIPDVFNDVLVRGIAEKSFYYAEFLTGVVIPPSVTVLGERSFFCCTALTEITLPDSVAEIGEYAFSGCSSLVRAELGSGLRTIKQRAFRECVALESIVIPEGTTTVGVRAFNGCVKLKSVSLPSTLTTVGGYAFTECTALETVTFNGARGALEAACTAEDKEVILDCKGLRCK